MQMDYMPPKKYIVGGNYVAFISYGNMLKFYYQQKVYELNEGAFVGEMLASNCLFAYKMDSNSMRYMTVNPTRSLRGAMISE